MNQTEPKAPSKETVFHNFRLDILMKVRNGEMSPAEGLNAIEQYELSQALLIQVFLKLKELEAETGLVTVLQFATHPSGNLAMIFRAYSTSMAKEYHIPDIVLLGEVDQNIKAVDRIEVLFEAIHKAINQIQPINPINQRWRQ